MKTGRSQIQVDVPEDIRNLAKAAAYSRGVSLTELVLKALTTVGDEKLTKAIKANLEERAQRGRPQNKK